MAGCGLIGARGAACATTATLVQFFQGEYDGAAVELRWILSEEPPEVALERAEANAEIWRPIPFIPRLVGVATVARDPAVELGRTYRYRLAWRLASGEWTRSEPVEVVAGTSPAAFALAPITPNPAAGALRLQWSMPHAGDVDLRIYDLAGREVAMLARGRFEAGQHVIAWNVGEPGRSMAAGVYFVRLRSGDNLATGTFLVRR